MSIAAYIQAGGYSSRYGSDKALLRFGNTKLLERTAELLRAVTPTVKLVAPAGKYDAFNIPAIPDPWPGEGPLGGIIGALQDAATQSPVAAWALIVSCDTPFLNSKWLRFLADTAARSNAQVVVPISDGRLEPLCACWRADAAGAITESFASGNRKVTQAMKQLRMETLDDSVWKRFDTAGPLFWNINTPEDYEEALRLWNQHAK